jgi:hypothetical protein
MLPELPIRSFLPGIIELRCRQPLRFAHESSEVLADGHPAYERQDSG